MLLGVLDLHPDLIYAHVLLGRIAVALKDCAEAARQFAAAGRNLPGSAAPLAAAYTCACRGQRDRARQYLQTAAASVPPPILYEIAVGYALLGDKDTTLLYLQKSRAANENQTTILADPAFDIVQADPRFAALR
jgi:Flp pilus assembly protein TadD